MSPQEKKETLIVQGMISYLSKMAAPTLDALDKVLNIFGYKLVKKDE